HDAAGRVHVGHRPDVRTRGVDARVDPELAVGRAFALQHVAVGVHQQHALESGQGRAGPGRYEEAVSAGEASADVAEGRDQAVRVGDVVGADQVLGEIALRNRWRAGARTPPG